MSSPEKLSRVLGLDLGTKTIGLAISDPTGTMAMSIGVLRRQGTAKDIARLGEVVREREIGEIVLGLPLRLNDAESAGSRRSREFATRIEAELNLPVRLVDEAFSTARAEEIMIELDVSRKKRKKAIDGLAAAVILQSWLNEREEGRRGR